MQPWQGTFYPSLSMQGGYQAQLSSANPQQNPQSHIQSGISSHYAQAYMQHNYATGSQQKSETQASMLQLQLPPPSASARWYSPGHSRCKKQGCPFTGSPKAVEIHMMDRHLIYPPGWEHRKRKDDWDADISLKGKPIPIQGTTVKLDTPEEIEKWIAERKKRFPTAQRVQEKHQKMEEAVARGQLAFNDPRFPNKKRRVEQDSRHASDSRGQMRGRGRGQGGMHHSRNQGLHNTTQAAPSPPPFRHHLPPKPQFDPMVRSRPEPGNVKAPVEADSVADDSDSDSPPEVISSKRSVPGKASDETIHADDIDASSNIPSETTHSPLKAAPKPPPRQPRRPSQNPFASRPALLRNLLLPEIRMTVSNLSQAIRFLVDNDFLENVELEAGQAERKMIEVINDPDQAQLAEESQP